MSQTPLPPAWVDKLFEKLTLTYGREFLDRWRGLDLAAVKADWGRELASFADHPDMLGYALSNLPPDRPPTVLQFKAIARKAPPPVHQALPMPKADPQRMREMLARARAALTKHAPVIGQEDAGGNVVKLLRKEVA